MIWVDDRRKSKRALENRRCAYLGRTLPTEIDNPYTFTGRRFDSESGLYYYRNRYYHAQMGRFVSRDSAAYIDGLNLYEFTKSAPIQFTDPSGNNIFTRIYDYCFPKKKPKRKPFLCKVNKLGGKDPVPPGGSWDLDLKKPNYIGFCYIDCIPCNKKEKSPITRCGECVNRCFKEHDKLCKKIKGMGKISCVIKSKKLLEESTAACGKESTGK